MWWVQSGRNLASRAKYYYKKPHNKYVAVWNFSITSPICKLLAGGQTCKLWLRLSSTLRLIRLIIILAYLITFYSYWLLRIECVTSLRILSFFCLYIYADHGDVFCYRVLIWYLSSSLNLIYLHRKKSKASQHFLGGLEFKRIKCECSDFRPSYILSCHVGISYVSH